MARIRHSSIGRSHGHLATCFREACASQDGTGLAKIGIAHVAYHVDQASRAAGEREALFALLEEPWHATQLRRLPDGAWREAADLYRLGVAARDSGRIDLFAIAVLKLEWARASAGAKLDGWRPALESLDEAALRGIALALKRVDQDQHRGGLDPPFWRTLLAVAIERMRTSHRPAPELLDLLAQPPFRIDSIDLELPAYLLGRAAVPLPEWAATVACEQRRAALEVHVAALHLAGDAAQARDRFQESGDPEPLVAMFEELSSARRFVDLAALLRSLDALAPRADRLDGLRVALEALPRLSWSDAGLRDAVAGLGRALPNALADTGWDAAGWVIGLLRRVESEYYGALSWTASRLVGIVEAPSLQRPLFDALLGHALERDERDACSRLGGLATFCLVRDLERRGAGLDERALERLAELERSLLPEADSDFLDLALARAAGVRGAVDDVIAHFMAIRDPWARGQALIRQPDSVAGDPRLWRLVRELVDYDLAVALSLLRFTETLRDGKPTAARFRALLDAIDAVPGASALVPTHFADTMVHAAAAGPDREDAIDVLGRWLHTPLAAATTDEVRSVLVASLECAIVPQWWPEPIRSMLTNAAASMAEGEREVLASLPVAASWGLHSDSRDEPPGDLRWIAWEEIIVGLHEGRIPGSAPSADVLVAMTNAAMVQDEGWPERLPPNAAAWLAARVAGATPTPHAMRLGLALGSLAPAEGADPLRYGLELGREPSAFEPETARRRAGTLTHTVFRWMHEHDERSRLLVRHVRDAGVRAFLASCEEEVRQSGIARPHRPLARPGRAALLWMGVAYFTRGRPARLVAGELIHRCGTSPEHAFVERWLSGRRREAA